MSLGAENLAENNVKLQAPTTLFRTTFCSMRSFNVFGSKTSPPSPPLVPTYNVCAHCHHIGHFSKNCPLHCLFCDSLGHIQADCEPHCETCHGSGRIRKTVAEVKDERPAVRQFSAIERGLKRAYESLKNRLEKESGAIEDAAATKLKQQLEAELAHSNMWAMRANGTLKELCALLDNREKLAAN